MLTTIIFCGTAATFLFMGLHALFHQRWARRLPLLPNHARDPNNPLPGVARCSVVIAARDEEGRIEQTIRCLLAQQGVDLEILVVDDRSSDGTPEILRRLAQEDARVRVKRVDVLPEGWLGKCHACHVGAE